MTFRLAAIAVLLCLAPAAVAADGLDGGRYIETPTMASYPLENDGSYRFDYTLDADTWTLERRDAAGTVVEREVWRRATPER